MSQHWGWASVLPLVLSSLSILVSVSTLTWTIYVRAPAVAWSCQPLFGMRVAVTNTGRRTARGVRWHLAGRALVGQPVDGPTAATGEPETYFVSPRSDFTVLVPKSTAAETMVLTVTWRAWRGLRTRTWSTTPGV